MIIMLKTAAMFALVCLLVSCAAEIWEFPDEW